MAIGEAGAEGMTVYADRFMASLVNSLSSVEISSKFVENSKTSSTHLPFFGLGIRSLVFEEDHEH